MTRKIYRPRISTCLTSVFTGMLLLFVCAPVQAREGMRYGKFDVDADVTAAVEYNDNVFWEADGEEEDVIFTLSPAVVVNYKMSPGNHLKLGYAADVTAYADFDDNNYNRHNPWASLALKPPSGLYLTMDDNFIYTEDPYGSENEYGLGRTTRRLNNTIAVATGFTFAKKYGVEASYTGFVQRYESVFDEWQDVNDNTFGIAVFYQATPKTKLFGQYQYREIEYIEQDDGAVMTAGPAWSSNTSQNNDQDLFFVGARFSPFAKISGEIKAGFGRMDHENAADRYGTPYEDEDTWVAQTRVAYRMRHRTEMSFMLNRSYKATSDEANDAPGYFDTTVGVGLTQKMKHRLTADLGLQWQIQDYQDQPGPEKKYDILRFNAGLNYAVNRRFDAGIRYQYKDKSASENAYENGEYTINSISCMVTGKY